MTTANIILLGALGGLVPDVLRFIKGRHKEMPGYLQKPQFYIGVVLLAGLGALAAWLMEAADVKQALAYGYAAPEVLSRLFAKTTGAVSADRSLAAEEQTVPQWWSM